VLQASAPREVAIHLDPSNRLFAAPAKCFFFVDEAATSKGHLVVAREATASWSRAAIVCAVVSEPRKAADVEAAMAATLADVEAAMAARVAVVVDVEVVVVAVVVVV